MAFNEYNKNKKLIYASAAQPYPLPIHAESTRSPKLDKEFSCQAEKKLLRNPTIASIHSRFRPARLPKLHMLAGTL